MNPLVCFMNLPAARPIISNHFCVWIFRSTIVRNWAKFGLGDDSLKKSRPSVSTSATTLQSNAINVTAYNLWCGQCQNSGDLLGRFLTDEFELNGFFAP